MKKEFILASGSEQRLHLLRLLNFEFTVKPAAIDETILPEEDPQTFLERVTLDKLNAIRDKNPQAIILAADTIALSKKKEILGKPVDASHAFEILKKINNTSHQVWTCISIYNPGLEVISWLTELDFDFYVQRGDIHQFILISDITFKKNSDDAIWKYINEKNPIDKAGAYGIQDQELVKQFSGSLSNIVGLPMRLVIPLLEPFWR